MSLSPAGRVKQQPVVKVRALQLGNYHAHGCVHCGLRYADTCKAPRENATCPTCRLGHPRTKEQQDRDPRACCVARSTLITSVDDLSKYDLGGTTPWYRCPGCARTHPYDPTKEQESS